MSDVGNGNNSNNNIPAKKHTKLRWSQTGSFSAEVLTILFVQSICNFQSGLVSQT